jgi:hypothetical protein
MFLLKLLFRIVALPLVPAFFLLSLLLKFIVWTSGTIFSMLSLLLAVDGVSILIQGDTSGGVWIIVFSFLLSPFGIPLFAETIGDGLDRLNDSIKDFIAGD